MDNFDKSLIISAIVGLYREIYYNVEVVKRFGYTMIKISDPQNNNDIMVVSVSVHNLVAAICGDEYGFAVEVIDRFANLMHLELIKVKKNS